MKTTLATIQKHGGNTIGLGYNSKEPIFYYFGALLSEQPCDEVNPRIQHTGWFCDDFQENKIQGIVVTLPGRVGFPDGVFLAGYLVHDSEERAVYPECYSDINDCARVADTYAEAIAQIERENNANFQAAHALNEKIEDQLQRLKECIALRHKACMGYVRGEIATLCQSIRDNRETLSTHYAGIL